MKIPEYNFRFWQEAAWAVGITAGIYVLTAFLATDDATDWQTWLPAVGMGAARAVAGALLSVLRPGGGA